VPPGVPRACSRSCRPVAQPTAISHALKGPSVNRRTASVPLGTASWRTTHAPTKDEPVQAETDETHAKVERQTVNVASLGPTLDAAELTIPSSTRSRTSTNADPWSCQSPLGPPK